MNKIKFVDKTTKSKVLLSAKWHHLSGNKHPYLSIEIHQVKLNGESVQGWQESKEAIKLISPELCQLVCCHLTNPDGSGTHEISSAKYFLGKVKEQITHPITYTSEDRHAELQHMLSELKYHKIFSMVYPCNHATFEVYFKHGSDRFKYPNVERSINHWLTQAAKVCKHDVAVKRLETEIKSFFTLAEKYSKLYHSFKQLPSKNDVWTCERFADQYGLQLSKVYEMICTSDTSMLDEMIEEKRKETKIFLDTMTEKFNIPLVRS